MKKKTAQLAEGKLKFSWITHMTFSGKDERNDNRVFLPYQLKLNLDDILSRALNKRVKSIEYKFGTNFVKIIFRDATEMGIYLTSEKFHLPNVWKTYSDLERDIKAAGIMLSDNGPIDQNELRYKWISTAFWSALRLQKLPPQEVQLDFEELLSKCPNHLSGGIVYDPQKGSAKIHLEGREPIEVSLKNEDNRWLGPKELREALEEVGLTLLQG